jgi:AhpD family alkylhydroperoxidase
MPRLDYRKASPEGLTAFGRLEAYLRHSGLESALLQLLRTRASRINGCAYCLDMHTKDARAEGETEQRLYTLSAWRETSSFSERERAPVALTEAVTRIAAAHVGDDVYAEAARHFYDKELADLVPAIIAINGWNRLAITFQATVGSYQPPKSALNTGATG